MAIEKCIKKGFDKDKFKTIDVLKENDFKLQDVFGTKFDIIFASEVLYYFNDDDMRKVLKIFNDAMSNNGIIMASMITYNHPYYRKYKINEKRRFVNVKDNNSIKEPLFVNILNGKEDIKELFDLFE